MGETNTQSQEIAGADIKISGEQCRMVLTGSFVGIHTKKGIFREATSIIPLGSIDSIFHGWRRYKILLYLGAALTLAGLVMLWQEVTGGGGALFSGVVFLLLFWFLRPRLLQVRSVRETLEGTPLSDPDAKNFIAILADAIARTR